MNEIGGYFELELPIKKELHQNAIRLNNGRNGFRYILRVKNPEKVYIPAYICDSIIAPLEKENIEYQFYFIDKKFEIREDFSLTTNQKLYYVNYFGMKERYLYKIVEKYGSSNIILDNTQSFYSKCIPGVSGFYSARKFFGVADGCYVYTDRIIEDDIPESHSYQHCQYLLGRLDIDAASFYPDFQETERNHSKIEMAKMSRLTQRILSSIDYDQVLAIRKKNFNFLHQNLCKYNELDISPIATPCPMIYPFKCSKMGLRQHLIDNNIFVPRYWTEVLRRVPAESFESDLTDNLLPLPIDQRYAEREMMIIVDFILSQLRIK